MVTVSDPMSCSHKVTQFPVVVDHAAKYTPPSKKALAAMNVPELVIDPY
jgi:hypothetical protein